MPTILLFYHECPGTKIVSLSRTFPSRNLHFNITNTLNFDHELVTLVFLKIIFIKQWLFRRFSSVLAVQGHSLFKKKIFTGEEIKLH